MSFAWSFSKLKNFEDCPKRHYEMDIAKHFKDDDTANLKWGNYVHDQLALALKGATLPAELVPYQKWVDRVRSGPGELLVEQKYALTKEFSPAPYFAPTVWYRGIADVVRVAGPVALALDWKTGKIKEGSVQLGLMAACLFANFPQVTKVRCEYIWLQEDTNTPEIFDRKDMQALWARLLPRVEKLSEAARTMTYPPKPGGLCMRYCAVTSCPFHKKGA
jgi:hypothetical protein